MSSLQIKLRENGGSGSYTFMIAGSSFQECQLQSCHKSMKEKKRTVIKAIFRTRMHQQPIAKLKATGERERVCVREKEGK